MDSVRQSIARRWVGLSLLIALAGCHAPLAKPRTPILVFVEETEYESYMGAINASLWEWNIRADCQLFSVTRDRAEADVVIAPYDGVDCDGPLKKNTAAFTCETVPAQIRTVRLFGVGQAFRIFLHEEGHVLKLADKPGYGVMNPHARWWRPGDLPEYWLISNEDAADVHRRFCQ